MLRCLICYVRFYGGWRKNVAHTVSVLFQPPLFWLVEGLAVTIQFRLFSFIAREVSGQVVFFCTGQTKSCRAAICARRHWAQEEEKSWKLPAFCPSRFFLGFSAKVRRPIWVGKGFLQAYVRRIGLFVYCRPFFCMACCKTRRSHRVLSTRFFQIAQKPLQ